MNEFVSRYAIQRYQRNKTVKTLKEKLQEEAEQKKAETQHDEKAQSLVSTIMSYFW